MQEATPPKYVPSSDNKALCYFVEVGGNITHCRHCSQPFSAEELMIALGKPYYCVVHKHCAYQYDYHKRWTLDKPLAVLERPIFLSKKQEQQLLHYR